MLKKVEDNILIDRPVISIILNGDPGCDGYNAEAVIILEETLQMDADFHMILGDMVPIGNARSFQQFTEIVNSISHTDVYCLPGNHDLPDYEEFCGKRNYFIRSENALFIILDNSRRYFTDETLEFLAQTLETHTGKNVFIFFHIPVPNSIVPNHISNDEWNKLKTIMDPYRECIQAIFCGHVHSAFEFNLDNYRVIVSGGGGALLDPVDNTFLADNRHHIFKLELDDSQWNLRIIPLDHRNIHNIYPDNAEGQQTLANLEDGFTGEAIAYRKYSMFASLAEKEGFPGIAKLFRAASESEFHHSGNMYLASAEDKSTHHNLGISIQREKEEFQKLYPDYIKHTENLNSNRARNAFECALHAEKVHHQLFSKALEQLKKNEDLVIEHIFTCSRCGYTHCDKNPPKLCPACGTDSFKFTEVE